MFTYSFLVVFELGERPYSRIGNGVFGFSTDLPDIKIPKIETIRDWERTIREKVDESTVVVTSFFPLAD